LFKSGRAYTPAHLPRLPKDLTYRFVGNALILIDVHANLILDFIQNAIR